MIALRHGPHRNVRRPLPRHAPTVLNDTPPADLAPFLAMLSDVATVQDAADVVAFVPAARRPVLLSWMVLRRRYRWEALHAALTSVPVDELPKAVGAERAKNWTRLYG